DPQRADLRRLRHAEPRPALIEIAADSVRSRQCQSSTARVLQKDDLPMTELIVGTRSRQPDDHPR
ncbi:MAG: hypothetical protein ABI255_07560, partial [Microbacteriaceae bacterium]